MEVLSGDGPFTVFAPTEEAFAAALDALGMSPADLLGNTELLTAVLTYHVLPLEAPAELVVTLDGQSVATVNGAEVTVTVEDGTVRVNDATVVTTDIEASNGIIHVIDTVLVPPDLMGPGNLVEVAVGSGAFPTLVAAVQAAGLVEVLSGDGPFTVFAPTEEAFAAALDALDMSPADLLGNTELLTAVLTYHVLPLEAPAELVVTLDGQSVATVNGAEVTVTVEDGTVRVNDATVVATDIEASNGIIHVIDTVLVPPDLMGPGNLVEVAVGSGAFPTLVAAVQAAGLVEVLSGDGPFTVFAPTEEAFAAALDALDMSPADLLGNTELLTAVLTYHVLPLEAPADATVVVVTLDGQSVATVNGAEVTVTAAALDAFEDGTVRVNDATVVVTTDIEASNGIIHVIDTVLIPPSSG